MAGLIISPARTGAAPKANRAVRASGMRAFLIFMVISFFLVRLYSWKIENGKWQILVKI